MVTMKEVDLDINIPATVPFTIMYQLLMVMVKAEMGLVSATLHPIN